MSFFVVNADTTINCSCGNQVPVRWINEGKIGLKSIQHNGKKSLQRYCVKCANQDEYDKLVSNFTQLIKTK